MYYGKYTWILWDTYFIEGWHTVGGSEIRKLTGWYGKYPHHLQGFSGFSTIQTVVVGDVFHQQYDLHHRKPTVDPPKLKVWFRWLPLSNRWFSGSILIFKGVQPWKPTWIPPKKHGFQYVNILFQGSIWRCHVFFFFFRVYSCNVWMLVRMIDDPTISSRWNGRHAKSFLGWWQYVSTICLVVKKGYIVWIKYDLYTGMALWDWAITDWKFSWYKILYSLLD